jgi:hypothetical protein
VRPSQPSPARKLRLFSASQKDEPGTLLGDAERQSHATHEAIPPLAAGVGEDREPDKTQLEDWAGKRATVADTDTPRRQTRSQASQLKGASAAAVPATGRTQVPARRLSTSELSLSLVHMACRSSRFTARAG